MDVQRGELSLALEKRSRNVRTGLKRGRENGWSISPLEPLSKHTQHLTTWKKTDQSGLWHMVWHTIAGIATSCPGNTVQVKSGQQSFYMRIAWNVVGTLRAGDSFVPTSPLTFHPGKLRVTPKIVGKQRSNHTLSVCVAVYSSNISYLYKATYQSTSSNKKVLTRPWIWMKNHGCSKESSTHKPCRQPAPSQRQMELVSISISTVEQVNVLWLSKL